MPMIGRIVHSWLCLVIAIAGCADATESGEAWGSLDLNLELAAGVVINEVAWSITRPGMAEMNGTIDTSAPGATASVEVFGLAPGDGYTVTLTAMVEGEDTTCGGSADFSVEAGVSTPVMVMLNCKTPERYGGVRVNGKPNICPELTKVVVSPLRTTTGNDIDLLAQAVDLDGDSISYEWVGDGGSFADPNASSTAYTCDEAGAHLIGILVWDHAFEDCADQWAVWVECVGDGGGAGGGGGDAGGAGGTGGAGGAGGTGGAAGAGGTGGAAGAPSLSVACTNNLTSDISILDWGLAVVPQPIEAGKPFKAILDGVAVFGESFLDAAQPLIVGGVERVNLVDLNGAVHVRSGAFGSDVILTAEEIPYECALIPMACDPANDLPSVPGLRGNADCEPQTAANPCGRFVRLPTSSDCSPGGVCDVLGKTGPASQCELNGFCITGSLALPLEAALGDYTASTQGNVLFGWDDQSTGATIQEGGPNDGTWILPPANYQNRPGPIGLRVTVGGIGVALQCTMGVDSKGPLGVDSLDFLSSPTPDSALISFPIESGTGGTGGAGGTGGTGATGGTGGTGGVGGSGGVGPMCQPTFDRCRNGTIGDHFPCCEQPVPDQANACDGTESLENPASCTETGNVVTHVLTTMEVGDDCNVGYDLDRCDGGSCFPGGLAPAEGLDGVDNAVTGLAPTLEGVGGNLSGVNQALADTICGATDDPTMGTCEDGTQAGAACVMDDQCDGGSCNLADDDCMIETAPADIRFAVDANRAENCANVTVTSGATSSSVILNITDPTATGEVCASGTIGAIPITIGGTDGAFTNSVVRMTISADGFSDGLLGVTIDEATAVAIAEALLEGGGAVVAQVLDINVNLTQDTAAACNALSSTLEIGGVAATNGSGGTGGMGGGGTGGSGGGSGDLRLLPEPVLSADPQSFAAEPPSDSVDEELGVATGRVLGACPGACKGTDPIDQWSITPTVTAEYRVALTWEPVAFSDLDLYLVDSNGSAIGQSATPGTSPETIVATLTAGAQFTIQVQAFETNGKTQPYTLEITGNQ